jgi:hypothetical protein
MDGQWMGLVSENANPKKEEVIMKNKTERFVVIIGIGLALITPINRAFGDEPSELFAKLSADWWQWALSIPTSVNPQTDPTGENAVVGQRGSIWYLAGVFGGGTVTRLVLAFFTVVP